MKVLHVLKLAGIAGAETYLLNILPELQKQIDCTYLAVINPVFKENAKKMTDILKSKNIKVIEIYATNEFSLKFYRQIANIIKEGNYTLINTHLIHADIYISIVKKLFIKDLVIASTRHGYSESYQTLHGFEPVFKWKDPYRYVLKFIDKYINRVCTISYGLKNLLVKLNITRENKIDVIHYGFNYGDVQYDTNTAKYRKSPHQVIILGRLAPVKGHEHIFRIMPELIKKYPDIALVLVGIGVSEEYLKAKVKELNLENYVYFEGFQTNVHDYMHNSDVAVIPSYAEGFCAVVLEAYQNYTPVISFDVPALNEIIFHNSTGLIVPKFDDKIMTESIIELMENKEKSKQLMEEGYHKLHTYFTIDRMVNETMEFYKKTLQSKP